MKSNGQYFVYTLFIASCLSSTTFLTGMAGNALIVKFAQASNLHIDWYTWFIGAIVPSIISIMILPIWLMKSFKVNYNFVLDKDVFTKANNKFTNEEIITAVVILLMLLGWIFGSNFNIKPTIVALLGVLALLFMQVISWKQLTSLSGAWD